MSDNVSGKSNMSLFTVDQKGGGKATKLLTKDASFKVADLYFKQKNIMYSHLHNSFDKFLDEDVKMLLLYGNNTFYEKATADKIYRYKFKFTDIAIKPPTTESDDEIMFPSRARTEGLTYAAKLVATITQIQEVVDIATDKVTRRVIGEPEYAYPITNIPIMVRSRYCSLNIKPGQDQTECKYDPGGYFIVNGQEKAVMSLERMIDNKPVVSIKKDSGNIIYTVQVNSRTYYENEMIQSLTVRVKKDKTLAIKVPILKEVPVFIVFRALGVESDRDIINMVAYDENDTELVNLIRISLEDTVSETNGEKIMTQDQAIDYLVNKMRMVKRYSETDKDIRHKERKMDLESQLVNNFLPHIRNEKIYKAYYLGYMINRLLNCYLGRYPIDDRDSYLNKRVDLPGTLIYELFKQYYKKMLNECTRHFKKRNNNDDNPPNIINQIKPNIIEGGLKAALMTGTWGKRKGVAQMLQRMTYLQTISLLRKINSPTVDASTNKLTGPRHLHPSAIPLLCFIETPEGQKVGLVKHLTLISNVTIMKKSQLYVLKSFLKDKIIDVQDVALNKLRWYTKIFLNGDWIGLTDEPRKLYEALRERKLDGTFDANTSVVHELKSEMETKELKIFCDSGRLYRPSLCVKDNELVLTQKHLDMIQIEEPAGPTQISNWQEFMMKNPGVIEYVDTDETANSMVAFQPQNLDTMKRRKTESHKQVKNLEITGNHNIINRYDDFTWVEYTHCEIHPSLMIGEVACNIPFCNHNQGPRNMYQYSQAKQAMGIYTSNYKDRLDISYILYNPQRPLITTRAMKYINTYDLPSGENAIVAIACYSGYNQEDSVIINQSAIDRGIFRSTSLKKYMTTVQKNQSTSQDDVFIKPDESKVVGMRSGSYDKLNERGYVPEETEIVNGDIIIGMAAPIQPMGNNNKTLKDKSEVYKSHVAGRVDRVWTDIRNQEGYEMRKMRIRSQRIPHIGDKMCNRHGQKGTIGITLPASDMPFTKNGIQPDIIMNPNAIPSRMTIGQLIECLLGKVSSIRGHETDGTPFGNIDEEKVKDVLESLGYERNGYEYLYNGMTGKRMKVMIFIGPTYYQRLKHMVSDKIHARAHGPRTLLTHQAPEGRSKEGGLRFGEMERDAMLAHCIARFLHERMMYTADAYDTHICGSCGLFAQRMMRKDNKAYATKDDIYWCPACRNKTDVAKIRIPYAAKLLFQEMMALSIAPRIRVKKNQYDM